MSTETTNKKIKIDNGTTFGRTYTDKAIDAKLPTDLIASANKLSLGAGNTALGNGVNLDGFTYDEATKTLKTSGSGGGISVIELTDKNGTIAPAQLGEINAKPQNFSFKYNGKILPFTSTDGTTYQYCNNTTTSSENNVMTASILLTITSSTGVYTIAENVHNVVANSIHPANGGDLTNIQVGSKVYSIPSGGGGGAITLYRHNIVVKAGPNRSFASFDLYTTSNTKFTNDSFVEYMQGKTIACTGRVLYNQKWYNISSIYGYSGGIRVEWYDLATIGKDSQVINYPNITDDIYQVE